MNPVQNDRITVVVLLSRLLLGDVSQQTCNSWDDGSAPARRNRGIKTLQDVTDSESKMKGSRERMRYRSLFISPAVVLLFKGGICDNTTVDMCVTEDRDSSFSSKIPLK